VARVDSQEDAAERASADGWRHVDTAPTYQTTRRRSEVPGTRLHQEVQTSETPPDVKYVFSAIVGALVALGMVVAVVFVLSVTGDDESPPVNKPYLDGTSYSCERINRENGEVYTLTQHACRLEYCRGGWQESEKFLPQMC